MTTTALLPTTKSFIVEVDYGLPLEDRRDNFDQWDSCITAANFPEDISGCYLDELFIVHFDRPMKGNEVLAEFDLMDLRPGSPVELADLFIGAVDQSFFRKELSIMALGTVWTFPLGVYRVARLWGAPGYWRLGLAWFNDQRNHKDGFLAARK